MPYVPGISGHTREKMRQSRVYGGFENMAERGAALGVELPELTGTAEGRELGERAGQLSRESIAHLERMGGAVDPTTGRPVPVEEGKGFLQRLSDVLTTVPRIYGTGLREYNRALNRPWENPLWSAAKGAAQGAIDPDYGETLSEYWGRTEGRGAAAAGLGVELVADPTSLVVGPLGKAVAPLVRGGAKFLGATGAAGAAGGYAVGGIGGAALGGLAGALARRTAPGRSVEAGLRGVGEFAAENLVPGYRLGHIGRAASREGGPVLGDLGQLKAPIREATARFRSEVPRRGEEAVGQVVKKKLPVPLDVEQEKILTEESTRLIWGDKATGWSGIASLKTAGGARLAVPAINDYVPKGYAIPSSPWWKKLAKGPGGEVYSVPKELARELDELPGFGGPSIAGAIIEKHPWSKPVIEAVGALDRGFNYYWKGLQVGVNPYTFSRNVLTNFYQMYLRLGGPALGKGIGKYGRDAAHITWGEVKLGPGWKGLKPGLKEWQGTVSGNGWSMTAKQMNKVLQEGGIHRSGMAGADLEREAKRLLALKQAGTKGHRKELLKPSVALGKLIEGGRVVQNAAEDYSKTLLFMMAMDRAKGNVQKSLDIVRHTLFDYSDLTGFERGLRHLIPFYCVPEEAEILTRRGWLRWDQVAETDEALTLDPETHRSRWEKILEVATFRFDGTLAAVGPFHCTDDHRWPVEVGKTFVKEKWYGGERKIVHTNELKHHHKIPRVAEHVGWNEKSLLSPRLAAILGWVVTDGYHRWRGNHCEMMVYQHPKKYLDKIVRLLETGERAPPHPDTGVVCVPVSNEDSLALRAVGFKSKADLPWIVSQLSREAAEAMYTAMFDAEGSFAGPKRETPVFSQNHGPVLDAFQILCALTRRAANISKAGCYVMERRKLMKPFATRNAPREYHGTIWCPRTPSGTWYMRYRGKVIFTGNTFMRKNAEFQVNALLKSPARAALPFKLVQAAPSVTLSPEERARYGSEIPSKHLKARFSVPTGREREGGFEVSPLPFVPGEEFQLGEIPFAGEGVSGSVKEAGRQFMSRASPLYFGVPEVFGEEESFTGVPYEQAPGIPQYTRAGPVARLAHEALSPLGLEGAVGTRALPERLGYGGEEPEIEQSVRARKMLSLAPFGPGMYASQAFAPTGAQTRLDALARLAGVALSGTTPERTAAAELAKRIELQRALEIERLKAMGLR